MQDDLSRLRTEYADRARRLAGSDIYSIFNRANLFAIHYRQRAILDALRSHNLTDLPSLRVLEIGCGSGAVLAEFRWMGVLPAHLVGVDLLHDRLARARVLLPESTFINADGQQLPFPSGSFDLVMQHTAVSSILDADLRRAICGEMLRVTRPGGLILSYDFWLNPTNRQTHGIRPSEIRRLFPNCVIGLNRITLAPPITRKLIGLSWLLCALLESLKLFNTHYLAAIHAPSTAGAPSSTPKGQPRE